MSIRGNEQNNLADLANHLQTVRDNQDRNDVRLVNLKDGQVLDTDGKVVNLNEGRHHISFKEGRGSLFNQQF
ncbi:TPA: hypothetical protein DDW69_00205 [candidate division CPR2 bacterium]|uniref:Uncharacterized protein n=1 Tax=candidate division CPR2 bacterium GW2011_GWC1_41_48 TaxID=1618344 RepID=A0A0G0W9I6_UNCC2|nr:MAG: hypothetical protein UT47_C0005G0028 [candidate division CPR2 bacterium GW2011_GWC2_39_35]KKR28489.1 MAG: hypothetical protein UT60_C0019G0024 [candidate division CPR2 bacterium GW2011_GWD2_39_7]KKS08717.1 MAG: hypothetical protein UU65_C0005G0028 [candidate division CPR2 bacterium GW2011_GWC1_41_48]OGB72754.1 MAG: hypothetical protein A2Y26_04760 [candidate division CPR2 bacterium GWD2_39_7]HBG81247.1 hypothetical protein [candidate division CPR2 bacterium]